MRKRKLRFLLLLDLALHRSGMARRSVIDGSYSTFGQADGRVA